MRDYCSERWEQRRTVCTPQSSFTGRGRNRRRRLFTTQKSLLLPFLTESHRLFSPEMIRHLAISLLWGGDEVTNVGRAITTPRRAELFWPEGNTPLSWISSTRVVLTHLRVPLPFTPHSRDDASLWSIHVSVDLCGWSSASGHENHQRAGHRRGAGEALAASHWL